MSQCILCKYQDHSVYWGNFVKLCRDHGWEIEPMPDNRYKVTWPDGYQGILEGTKAIRFAVYAFHSNNENDDSQIT